MYSSERVVSAVHSTYGRGEHCRGGGQTGPFPGLYTETFWFWNELNRNLGKTTLTAPWLRSSEAPLILLITDAENDSYSFSQSRVGV